MVWRQLMQIYSVNEQWKELEKLSEQSIDYYPNQALTYFYAARAKMYLKKFSEAHDLLTEAIDYSADKSKFQNEIKLVDAYIYFLENKSDKCEEILDSIDYKVKQEHPLYFEYLGDKEYKSGNIEKAKEYWKKSIDLGNSNSGIKEKLKVKNY